MSKRILFIIWTAVLFILLYLLLWPILLGIWAGSHWDKVPCGVTNNGSVFVYSYQGENYYSGHMDFWNKYHDEAVLSGRDIPLPQFDHICYVFPGHPKTAVLNVDSFEHLDHASNAVVVSVFVVICGGVLTYAAQKRRRPLPPAQC
ncbi:MAG: hypothetical protein ACTHN5_03410 [Phycisphaerae bacterium]